MANSFTCQTNRFEYCTKLSIINAGVRTSGEEDVNLVHKDSSLMYIGRGSKFNTQDYMVTSTQNILTIMLG